MSDHRPSWDDYFFRIAAEVATRATCPRASIGAVLSDPLMGTSATVVLRHVAIEAQHLNLIPVISPDKTQQVREAATPLKSGAMRFPIAVDMVNREERTFRFPATNAYRAENLEHLVTYTGSLIARFLLDPVGISSRPNRLVYALFGPALIGVIDLLQLLTTFDAECLSHCGRAMLAPPAQPRSFGGVIGRAFSRSRLSDLLGLSLLWPLGFPLTVIDEARLAGSLAIHRGRFLASPAGLR